MPLLEDLLEEALPYFPRVYHQSSYTPTPNETLRNFGLIYKFTRLPQDSLLYFVPSQQSVNGVNNLVIQVPKQDGTYLTKTFKIVVETNNGSTRVAGKDDIIPYRMCLFRFPKSSTNTIILTNSPQYNSLKVTNLEATNATFLNVPKVGGNILNQEALIKAGEFQELVDRVTLAENKVIAGMEDPDIALADKPNGTIYIQVEEE